MYAKPHTFKRKQRHISAPQRDVLVALSAAVLLVVMMVRGAMPLDAVGIMTGSDVLTRTKAGVLADHEIQFVTTSGVPAAGTVSMNFVGGTGNPFSLGFVAFGDVDFAVSSAGCGGVFTEQGLAATASGATWGVGVSGTTITLTSGTGTVPAGRCVRVRIGTNAVFGGAGVNRISNPGSASTIVNPVRITLTAGADTGSISVGIVDNDQVTVSGVVDQVLTVSTSSASCSLGTLSATALNACSYDHVVTTNATGGYSTTVADLTVPTTLVRSGGAETIPATDGTMTVGTSEYGIATSDTGGAVVIANQAGAACVTGNGGLTTAASAITGVGQVIADAPSVVISDTVTICHKATMSSGQTPGSYAQTVTLSTTANF